VLHSRVGSWPYPQTGQDQETNTLAQIKNLYSTAVKYFIALDPGTNIIDFFNFTNVHNKLECRLLALPTNRARPGDKHSILN
jgi:hypothetical protein